MHVLDSVFAFNSAHCAVGYEICMSWIVFLPMTVRIVQLDTKYACLGWCFCLLTVRIVQLDTKYVCLGWCFSL